MIFFHFFENPQEISKKTRRQGGDILRKKIAIGVDSDINELARQIERLKIGVDELFATKSGAILASKRPNCQNLTKSAKQPCSGARTVCIGPMHGLLRAYLPCAIDRSVTTVAIIGRMKNANRPNDAAPARKPAALPDLRKRPSR